MHPSPQKMDKHRNNTMIFAYTFSKLVSKQLPSPSVNSKYILVDQSKNMISLKYSPNRVIQRITKNK
jgi:hypothetical protein